MRLSFALRNPVKPIALALLFACATLLASGAWRAEQADVRAICQMTTGGSFDAKTAMLSGSLTPEADGSSTLAGSLSVDLRTVDTGIGLRNQHLRETYLEVDKEPGFDHATISSIELKGLNPDAPQGKGSFTGSLTLHGVTKTVGGAIDVRSARGGQRIKATFPLNLSDYAIREPRYLGVGVKNTLQVEASFDVIR